MRLNSIRIGLLLLSILCFVLPFVRISCDDKPFKDVMGVELATGKTIHALDFMRTSASDSLQSLMKSENLEKKGMKVENKENEDVDMSWEALTALILAFLALLALVVDRKRVAQVISGGLATLAFLALAILYFNMTANSGKNNIMKIDVEYKMMYGYWITVCLLLLAAVLGFLGDLGRKPEAEAPVLSEDSDKITFTQSITSPPVDGEDSENLPQ